MILIMANVLTALDEARARCNYGCLLCRTPDANTSGLLPFAALARLDDIMKNHYLFQSCPSFLDSRKF